MLSRDMKSAYYIQFLAMLALVIGTQGERAEIEFAGSLCVGSMFFVTVDSHSKWLEVEPMEMTTTESTLGVLRSLFGLPKQLSDNGSQFTS